MTTPATKLHVKMTDILIEQAIQIGRLKADVQALKAENKKLRLAKGIDLDGWIYEEPSHLSIVR